MTTPQGVAYYMDYTHVKKEETFSDIWKKFLKDRKVAAKQSEIFGDAMTLLKNLEDTSNTTNNIAKFSSFMFPIIRANDVNDVMHDFFGVKEKNFSELWKDFIKNHQH